VILTIVLACAAVLLALAPIAAAPARRTVASSLVYGISMIVSAISFVAALSHLLGGVAAETTILPIGVPWLGAHFPLSVMGGTKPHRAASCRSIPPFSPS
jgi:hydrogenase-4 component B